MALSERDGRGAPIGGLGPWLSPPGATGWLWLKGIGLGTQRRGTKATIASRNRAWTKSSDGMVNVQRQRRVSRGRFRHDGGKWRDVVVPLDHRRLGAEAA